MLPGLGYEVLSTTGDVRHDLKKNTTCAQLLASLPICLARQRPVDHVLRSHEEIEGRVGIPGRVPNPPIVMVQLGEEILPSLETPKATEPRH